MVYSNQWKVVFHTCVCRIKSSNYPLGGGIHPEGLHAGLLNGAPEEYRSEPHPVLVGRPDCVGDVLPGGNENRTQGSRGQEHTGASY